MGPSFTIAGGPRQRRHPQVRVPPDSWSHFTVSDSRLPQLGGPCPRICILQEQGGLVILPGTGFPTSSHHTTRKATVEVFDPASTRAFPMQLRGGCEGKFGSRHRFIGPDQAGVAKKTVMAWTNRPQQILEVRRRTRTCRGFPARCLCQKEVGNYLN
jgi:hypothetical protein